MSLMTTVHEFVAPDSAPNIPSQLEQGRQLALACSSSSNRWVTPQSTIVSSVFKLRHDRLYRYRLTPPLPTSKMWPASIPQWGQPSRADDPDHLRLHDLQEFESTDFTISLMNSRTGEVRASRDGKRVQGDGWNVNELAKRPRLENCSILDLIPQPHFIPAPAAKYRPVDTAKIPPYHKTFPSPIALYDAATVDQLLNCKYRRAAWLIPVRGSLPWDGASMAILLGDTQATSRSPSPCLQGAVPQPRPITWTPDSLQHFWTFLGSIQRAKHLGPLSLSFHAAPLDTLTIRDSFSEPVWESNRPYYHQLSEQTPDPSGDFAIDICSAPSEGIDYIKVFHDIPYSLSLRNILDAYRYEPDNGEVAGRSTANDRKIRLLKGAQLVLMDERSKAACLM